MRCVLFLCLLASAWCAPEQYRISSLPGWTGPLPSKMYSGYADAGVAPNKLGKMHMHYWFVESEGNPKTDPLVLWYNGGPGASSLFGLLVELGPLLLNELSFPTNSTVIPQLIKNPFAWSKVANILAVENPPPVGFSYCDPAGPAGDGYSCGTWNDSLVAKANHEFLVNWFKDFPEYARNDLYITGESYAGVYVPTIVREILKDPRGMNLKGFAVGDGCIGTDVLCGDHLGPWWSIEFMHGHGQVPNEIYNQIINECPQAELKNGNVTKHCDSLIDSMFDMVGGYYAYNLYDTCIGKNIFLAPKERNWWGPISASYITRGALNDYPCPGDAQDIWINRTDVRRALHVAENANYFSGDNGVGFNYETTEKNLLPFYEHCIKNTSLRILVYNGDTDPSINSFVTQDIYFNYMKKVGIPQKRGWTPWTIDGKERMGGYVTEFAKGNFAYLTIRGSGHMVPEYKPEAALAFLTAFLRNQPYPTYNNSKKKRTLLP